MPREAGPERAHFGGEQGLVTELVGGKTKHFWRCDFCGWQLGGKCFANSKARIHLSGDPTLKNGMVADVCDLAPAKIKAQFQALERLKRTEKEQKQLTRKRGAELMAATPSPSSKKSKRTNFRQPQIPFSPVTPTNTDEFVDSAWGMAFFGLDIAPNKIDNPLFKEAIHATQRSSSRFAFKPAIPPSCMHNTIYIIN